MMLTEKPLDFGPVLDPYDEDQEDAEFYEDEGDDDA